MEKKYSNKDITTSMGIWNNKFYSIVKELDLPKAQRTYPKERTQRKANIKVKTPKENNKENTKENSKENELEFAAEPVQEIITNGIHFGFTGTYAPDHIQSQMLKFASLLDGETDDFYIELKLMQKQPSKKK